MAKNLTCVKFKIAPVAPLKKISKSDPGQKFYIVFFKIQNLKLASLKNLAKQKILFKPKKFYFLRKTAISIFGLWLRFSHGQALKSLTY